MREAPRNFFPPKTVKLVKPPLVKLLIFALVAMMCGLVVITKNI